MRDLIVVASGVVLVWTAAFAQMLAPIPFDTHQTSTPTVTAIVQGPGNCGANTCTSTLPLNNASSGSGTAVFGSNVTSGNVVVVAFGWRDVVSAAATLSVTDTRSTSYTAQASECNSGLDAVNRSMRTDIYSGVLGSSGADTVTVSISGANTIKGGAIWVFELSGTGAFQTASSIKCGFGTNANSAFNTSTGAGSGNVTFTASKSPFLLASLHINASAACTFTGLDSHLTVTVQDGTQDELDALSFKGTAISSPFNFSGVAGTCTSNTLNGWSELGAAFGG